MKNDIHRVEPEGVESRKMMKDHVMDEHKGVEPAVVTAKDLGKNPYYIVE
jgi:hypothetical protein